MYYNKKYSIIDPLTIAQKARIEADGGMVIDFWRMNRTIATLRAMGLYGNCKLITSAWFGVKKNMSNRVSRLYDISGNNNDLFMDNSALMPIWTDSAGVATIVYDGVDDYLVLTNHSVFSGKSALSIFVNQKVTNSGGVPIVLGAFGTGAYIRINRNSFQLPTTAVGWYGPGTSVAGVYSSQRISYCFTFDGSFRRAYTNGVYTAISTPATTGNTQTFAQAIAIGGKDQSSTNYTAGEINQLCVLNTAATSGQISIINDLIR